MDDQIDNSLQPIATTEFCYLTTTGRVTGRPHTIEIWFALSGHTLYFLAGSGAKADWIKNAQHEPQVRVRIDAIHFVGNARLIEQPDEDALARRIVVAKYQPGYGSDLSDWGRTSLPLAVDIVAIQDEAKGS